MKKTGNLQNPVRSACSLSKLKAGQTFKSLCPHRLLGCRDLIGHPFEAQSYDQRHVVTGNAWSVDQRQAGQKLIGGNTQVFQLFFQCALFQSQGHRFGHRGDMHASHQWLIIFTLEHCPGRSPRRKSLLLIALTGICHTAQLALRWCRRTRASSFSRYYLGVKSMCFTNTMFPFSFLTML